MPLHVSSTMSSSSGDQNCIIQPLVSLHPVGGLTLLHTSVQNQTAYVVTNDIVVSS